MNLIKIHNVFGVEWDLKLSPPYTHKDKNKKINTHYVKRKYTLYGSCMQNILHILTRPMNTI